jgi:hypothetical protein
MSEWYANSSPLCMIADGANSAPPMECNNCGERMAKGFLNEEV